MAIPSLLKVDVGIDNWRYCKCKSCIKQKKNFRIGVHQFVLHLIVIIKKNKNQKKKKKLLQYDYETIGIHEGNPSGQDYIDYLMRMPAFSVIL